MINLMKMKKNIINLTKIFTIDMIGKINIFNKKDKKINKKSSIFWLSLIVIIGMSYVSLEVVQELRKIGQEDLFLNLFFIIMSFLAFFQVSLLSSNIYYFSDDTDLLLPLPIISEELLISKFNTLIINMYFTEAIFAVAPLLIYGIMTDAGIMYYIYTMLILLIFPVLPTLIVSIIMMIFMKLFKFIKNKNVLQVLIVLFFMIIMTFAEQGIINELISNSQNIQVVQSDEISEFMNNYKNKINNVNKCLLQNYFVVNMLSKSNKFSSILELIKLILMNLLFFIIFIVFGKITYLKDILRNNNFNKKDNSKKNIKIIERKSKRFNKIIAYIRKEFKILFKTPSFFMQALFPSLALMVALILIILRAVPNVRMFLESDIFNDYSNFTVDIKVICFILAIMQIIYTFSNISVSAISREGKNAKYIKIFPINLFTQFKCKSFIQTFINCVLSFVITILIKKVVIDITYLELFYIFIISVLLNIMNSDLLVCIDLLNPNISWGSDYEVIKENKNKLFQYVLTILNVLLLVYFSKVFKNVNLNLSCWIIVLILFILNILINFLIKKNIKKLFSKIH